VNPPPAGWRGLQAAERRWLAIVAGLLLLLTLVPLAVAAARTPAGEIFGGFVYEARDGDSYVAKTVEGLQGNWLYHDPYTSEAQPQSLIFAPYLALGQLDRILGLPVPLVLHLARLALAAALLVAVYLLCSEVFPDPGRRRLAFLLSILGGGLGFLAIAHAEVLGYHYVSLDIGVSGSTGLDTLNLAPHIAIACLGATWAAILWIRSATALTPPRLAGGLLWVLLVSSVYPQLAAMLAVVAVVAWISAPRRSTGAVALAWIAGAVPYVAYGLALKATNPTFAGWPPASDVDIGDPLSYLLWAHLAMVPFVVVTAIGVVRRRRAPLREDRALGLLLGWIAVSAILMYLPGLPSVLHRLYYASFVPFGVAAAAGLWSWAQARGSATARRRALVYGCALICLVAVEIAAEGLTIALQHRDDLALYFPADEATVLGRLKEAEPAGDKLVMNSYLSGLFVPGLSGQRTYTGFPFETLDIQRKEANVLAFYRASDPSVLRSEAASLHIDYLLWGVYERGLGGRDPGQIAGWPVVATSGMARLYKVAAGSTAAR